MTFTPFRNVSRFMGQYREEARGFGYQAAPEQMGWALPIYVGETDEAAMNEARPHAEYLFNQLVRRPLPVSFPPGYLTERSAKAVLRAFSSIGTERTTIEQLDGNSQIIIGSAETVTRRLRECIDESGIGTLVVLPQFGSMPHEQAIGNAERFAQRVMPALRGHVSAVYR